MGKHLLSLFPKVVIVGKRLFTQNMFPEDVLNRTETILFTFLYWIKMYFWLLLCILRNLIDDLWLSLFGIYRYTHMNTYMWTKYLCKCMKVLNTIYNKYEVLYLVAFLSNIVHCMHLVLREKKKNFQIYLKVFIVFFLSYFLKDKKWLFFFTNFQNNLTMKQTGLILILIFFVFCCCCCLVMD